MEYQRHYTEVSDRFHVPPTLTTGVGVTATAKQEAVWVSEYIGMDVVKKRRKIYLPEIELRSPTFQPVF